MGNGLARATRTVVPPAFDCKGTRSVGRQTRVCLPQRGREVQEWIGGRYFQLAVCLRLRVCMRVLNSGVSASVGDGFLS